MNKSTLTIDELVELGHMRNQELKRKRLWKGPTPTKELARDIAIAVAERCRREGLQLPEKTQGEEDGNG